MPTRFGERWADAYRVARERQFEELCAESLNVQRDLLHSRDERIQLKAVEIWLKRGAGAFGPSGWMVRPIPSLVARPAERAMPPPNPSILPFAPRSEPAQPLIPPSAPGISRSPGEVLSGDGRGPRAGGFMRVAGFLLLAALLNGCTRAHYRNAADRETYPIVANRAGAAGFATERLHLEPDSTSRLADPTLPDKPPKPPDDEVAAAYMDRPNGMHGAHWHRHGEIDWIEPPDWEAGLPLGTDGKLKLDANASFELALLHSREYQTRLERLYTVALALTLNRFEFQTRWFGRNATNYTSAAGGTPNETSTLDTTSNVGFQRAFAAGGQLAVDFANSFVIEYLGSGRTAVSSSFVANFVQPLLRNAGRRVRLEQLTQAERDVLYEAREFYRFRKQFWASVTTLDSGYLQLLLQVQTIRNFEAFRVGQEQNLRLHEELFRGGKKSIVEVDQAFQSFQQARLNLTQGEASLQTSLDQFKIVLGLPPRIPVILDDTALSPFVLVEPKLEAYRDVLEAFQKARNRDIDAAPTLVDLRKQFGEFIELAAKVEPFERAVAGELDDWGLNLPDADTDHGKRARTAYAQFRETYPEAATDFAKIKSGVATELGGLGEGNRKASWEALVSLTRKLLTLTDQVIAVQTQIRINRIELPEITWNELDGLTFAKTNRLDLATAQASVTDAWRKMEVAANALRGELNLVADARVGTASDPKNAFDFAADASRFRVGVQIDGPLNRQAERNAYRASQILYQQSRRSYMLLSDQIEQAVRNDFRSLEVQRVNFEIARLNVVSAARQLEASRQQILQPRGASDTTTLNILNALNSLLAARNALAAGYINFEQLRVQLLLDLEALRLDPRGYPIDERRPDPFVPFAADRGLPPAVAVGPAGAPAARIANPAK